jgi:hypothetical protein
VQHHPVLDPVSREEVTPSLPAHDDTTSHNPDVVRPVNTLHAAALASEQ